jgi:hypothetical protein
MRAAQPTTAGRSRRVALVLASVVSLLAAVGLMTSSPATAGTAPASIRIDSVTSDIQAPTGTPTGAVPVVLAKIGTPVHVHVSLYDSSGLPTSFTKDTVVTVTSTGNRGGLTQPIKTVPANDPTPTIDVSFTQAANGIVLTATVGKGGNAFSDTTLGETDKVFDVAKLIDPPYGATPGTSLRQGIGGDTACQNATSTEPICGVLVLPHGAQTSGVLLSEGVCDDTVVPCRSTTKGSVVQALADLSGLYSNADPATLIMKCDKTLCPGGAIQSYHVLFSRDAAGGLRQADPCPAKGTLGPGQDACVDYVQSTRDNSGDTHLYLLFTGDMRGSVG